MNAGQLHRLAQVLRKVAQVATSNPGERTPAVSTVAVVEDVSEHPDAAIKDIVQRTGLAQSLVSRTVDTLRQRGVLLVTEDPADGRRTLVNVDPKIHDEDFVSRGARSISTALREVRPDLSEDQRIRIEAALDLLATELLDKPESPGKPHQRSLPMQG